MRKCQAQNIILGKRMKIAKKKARTFLSIEEIQEIQYGFVIPFLKINNVGYINNECIFCNINCVLLTIAPRPVDY